MLPWDGNSYASLYSPNPNVTVTPWFLSLPAGAGIQLAVTHIPAAATLVLVTVDGCGIGVHSFPAGTPSTGITVGVPAGGPYRVRAKAYDGISSGNPVLRSGKATGIVVASGSTAASIGFADISVRLDAVAAASAPPGSVATFHFHISDPGDVVEETFPSLYGEQQPFSIRSGSTALARTSVVPIAAGTYLATFL